MPANTSYYQLPYPLPGDPPDGAAQMQALAQAVEDLPPKIDNLGDSNKNFRIRSPRVDVNGHIMAVGIGASPRWASVGSMAGEDLMFTQDNKVCIRLGISGLSNTNTGTSDHGICVEMSGSNTTNLNIKRVTTNSSGDDMAFRVAGNDARIVRIVSSRRFKKNIETMPEDMSASVLSMRPVTYEPKDEQLVDDPHPNVGLIAEEVAELLPNVVGYDDQGQPETVRYTRLVVPLIGVVKQQQERIDALEQRLAALEAA